MDEIQSVLKALKFGSRVDKFRALVALEKPSPSFSEEVRQVVGSLLNQGLAEDDFSLALAAGVALAANGDESDVTIAVLLQGLGGGYEDWVNSEPDRFERFLGDLGVSQLPVIVALFDGPEEEKERLLLRTMWAQCDSLRALSGMSGRPDIVDAVIKTAQSFDRFRTVSGAALYALGVIGSEQALEFLNYQAEDKGRSEAKAALDLFGQVTFDEILSSELCPRCGRYSLMQKEKGMFGEKRRCKRCGETHKAKS